MARYTPSNCFTRGAVELQAYKSCNTTATATDPDYELDWRASYCANEAPVKVKSESKPSLAKELKQPVQVSIKIK